MRLHKPYSELTKDEWETAFDIQFSMDSLYEWDRWTRETPTIPIRPEWKSITPIPPFAGAVSRFLVHGHDGGRISIYLDCYERLGFFGGPHWEIYPNAEGDNERFDINDVESLADAISKALLSGANLE